MRWGSAALPFAQAGGDIDVGAFEDIPDFPSQAVGFVDAANLRVAKAGAEQAAQLPVTVQAFVVHFDDEDVVESGKNILQPRRERMKVADGNGRNAVARGPAAIDRFLDRALGPAPADQEHIAFRRAGNAGGPRAPARG